VPYNEDLLSNSTQCPGCKAIFNYDLHLRSYSDDVLKTLFEPYGFKLVEGCTLIKSKVLWGLDTIKSIVGIKPIHKKTFYSPICPICGYENSQFSPSQNIHNEKGSGISGSSSKNIKGIAKSIIKGVWPKKEFPGYWVIALYKKDN